MKHFFAKLTAAAVVIGIIFSAVPAVSAQNEDFEFFGKSRLAIMERGDVYVEAYERIYDCVEDRGHSAVLSDLYISENELKTIVSAYKNDPTGHFWADNMYSYSLYSTERIVSFMPYYNDLAGSTEEEFQKNRKTFDDAAKALLKKAGITDDMTEFEKEHLIHDTLIGQTDYVDTPHAHTAYGALVEHKAVCDGYSKAFQYLLRLCGIQAHLVSGTAGGGAHAWNLVRINQNYYYTDITWDDPIGGDEDENDFYHGYFNVTSNLLRKDHTWTEPAYGLPDCVSSAANLYTIDPERTVDCNCSLTTIASLFHNGNAYVHIADDADLFISWFYQNCYEIAAIAGYDISKPLVVYYSVMNDEYRLSFRGTMLPTEDPDGGKDDADTDPEVMKGDINFDSKLSAIDSNLMKRIISGTHDATDLEFFAADINSDSKIDIRDSNLLKRTLSGK